MKFSWLKSKSQRNSICSICGKEHNEVPHLSMVAPDYWLDRYAEQDDCYLDDDLCIIMDRDYFIRGVIEIPVIGSAHAFGWNIWISQKKDNFLYYKENFTSKEIGPYFGWVSNSIPYYEEETINLQSRAVFRGDGMRPKIELAPVEHEMYRHYRDGITLDEIHNVIHRFGN